MGILERTRHVIRADLNDLVRKARNPEEVLAAYLEDLEAVRAEASSLRAAESAERDAFESRLRDLQSAQDNWVAKARSAVRQGEEALARAALDKKLDLQDEIDAARDELEQRRASLEVLEDSLESLRLRISEVGRKRRELRMRRQVIQARSELQQAMNRLEADRDAPLIEEAEQGLSEIESSLEASEALDAEGVERRMLKLEADARKRRREQVIADELDAIKAELKKG
ncbi:MAG: PspA/IM30 family protein [Deltaproteobacteria bacterium]|nr:PspA/IM30 family protein [Deltaproteobacteria bacterium]